MASSGVQIGLLVVLIAMFWTGTLAQSSCTNVIIGMASCLNYVTGSSSTPSPSCCSSLANVVESNPRCLCAVLNGGDSSFGFTLNRTLALELPGKCNVQTPPVSKCDTANGPATSPIGSPQTSPADPSNGGASDTPTASGSKTVPASGNTSDASVLKMPLQLIAIVVFMASYASNFGSF